MAGCVPFFTLIQCFCRPPRYRRSRCFETKPSTPFQFGKLKCGPGWPPGSRRFGELEDMAFRLVRSPKLARIHGYHWTVRSREDFARPASALSPEGPTLTSRADCFIALSDLERTSKRWPRYPGAPLNAT
jgi:hypothetical protein